MARPFVMFSPSDFSRGRQFGKLSLRMQVNTSIIGVVKLMFGIFGVDGQTGGAAASSSCFGLSHETLHETRKKSL